MTEKDKKLLLQDLCGRLPYGVKVKTNNINILKLGTHTRVGEYVTDVIEPCKPYLFPLSSMTEEQIEEAKTYFWKDVDYSKSLVDKGINCFYPCFNILEFYHKNHLDYRGLIPMGLAINAANLNVY